MKPVRFLCYMFLWAWKCTTFKSVPVILIVLTNKNVALIYSVTICQQKTKDCALSGCFWHKLHFAALLFLSLMFAAFHNHSLLITMSKLICNGEENSLRHVAMVVKFLDENKPKKKVNSHTFKLHRSYSISFNQCQMLAKFSGLNPKGPYLSLGKRKRNFLCCAHLRHKAGALN